VEKLMSKVVEELEPKMVDEMGKGGFL